MAYFDLSLEELCNYLPESTAQPDFDEFWQNTLAQARRSDLSPHYERTAEFLVDIEAYDVTYSGYAGQPIKAWLLLPRRRVNRLPCIVEYVGYGGGRGFVWEWLFWPALGYAHFVMDIRGQGSSWRRGDTPDIELEGSNPHYPGFMTRGVLSPDTYYYRRLFTDAVRAIDLVRSHPAIDPDRIAVTGGSQGGGICLAVSALVPEIQLNMPDVPFLCHFRRATQITDAYPYQEIVAFCKTHRDKVEQVFITLSYFDGMNFARRAKATALFSTALMDDVSPPSTVYAAYNHYAGSKQMNLWEFNKHEGGGSYQSLEKVQFIKQSWG